MPIIDRFEGDWAVIELEQKTFNIPQILLPKEAKEGDVINITVTIDKESTAKQKESINKLADSLFEE